jgi:hypothetical protein
MLIHDDGRKTEICNKFIAYGVSIQIIVLKPYNNKFSHAICVCDKIFLISYHLYV